MTQAKINTIRTYVPFTDVAILDKFAAAGIKIIIGFPNTDDTKLYPDISSGTYLAYVNTYKNHDAILMWELGNEYNYHPEWFGNNINNWYTILNNAAAAIQAIDPNHPVSTAHGEVPTNAVLDLCPNVDVWGMNVYRWDNPVGAINEFAAKSNKPCYLSEAGGDRYNNTLKVEDQQAQAKANLAIWNDFKSSVDKCSGIAFFAFVDEWWKGGSYSTQDASGFTMSIPYDNYSNEEWYGIVDIDRNITLSYTVLKNAFIDFISATDNSIELFKKSVYPIPVKDKINITSTEALNQNVTFNISTLSGSPVVSGVVWAEGNQILISLLPYNLPDGVYTLLISGKFGNISHVFVKK
jgi:hypothetical protein